MLDLLAGGMHCTMEACRFFAAFVSLMEPFVHNYQEYLDSNDFDLVVFQVASSSNDIDSVNRLVFFEAVVLDSCLLSMSTVCTGLKGAV